MNIVARPLLNITEAFEKLDIGQAIEVDYAIGTVRNAKQNLKSISKKTFSVKKSKISGKPCIIRIS